MFVHPIYGDEGAKNALFFVPSGISFPKTP
ncbi:MAG: hypothetical protein UR87_C0022G0020 [candidate division CPR3 bacterium GW2011_GWE2_35_7]|uniref:Uncharacterized protein n=1 Tax=candidate division CPR3 bacterium GW2011_GWF2_35_18 TaxID=1618350 RepID=A0A0G0C2C5_UNCC3|nr:MAG: hypothetical protein UR67_C0001G0110 [candidate division CPR3 bacterium GW2011_GWF2_35_18]KKP86340.1 MAG: hypothetical protein UR87_C0022G0020 [candidate division CPR3 bacterium GW2011_GWE2_35_7]